MSTVASTATLKITIPMTPPYELSPNRITRISAGQRTRIKGEWARTWYLCAYQAVYEARYGEPFPEFGVIADAWRPALFNGSVRCRITVFRGKGAKPWDRDNLLASCKYGIDQLQYAGVVRNDNQLIFDSVEQERDPEGRGYTVVDLASL